MSDEEEEQFMEAVKTIRQTIGQFYECPHEPFCDTCSESIVRLKRIVGIS